MSTPTPRTDEAEFKRQTTCVTYRGVQVVVEALVASDFARTLEREVSQLTDALDMMRDEFQRIIACPGCNSEIEDLADRAQLKLLQHVPVIVQRDRAEMALAREREKVRTLRSACESICEEWGKSHDAPFYAGSEMEKLASKALEKTEDAK